MANLSKTSQFMRKVLKVGRCGAVIVAAGSATRMGGIDKVMAELEGKPLFLYAAEAFEKSNVIQEIVIVTRQDLILPINTLCHEAGLTKLTAVIAGGESRQESVANGLSVLSRRVKLAAIHDAARPFVSAEVIDRTVRAAHSYAAAAPAIPVKDTIKVSAGGIVESTPDRSRLFAVQTPQVFDYDLIRGALVKAAQEKAAITDDCSAVERMGMSVKLVEGDEANFKVTTPLDLALARTILKERANP